ncbi:hypothetical protein [Amycolatopsis sp. NPDC051372]|uniref:hypothetical protein n=1 Tax=unclassified Amycolatopsis TaxID=2618356 RepID=UPI00342EE55B
METLTLVGVLAGALGLTALARRYNVSAPLLIVVVALGFALIRVRAAYFRITAALDQYPRTFDSGRVLTGNDVRIAAPPFLEKPATYPVIASLMALGDGQDLPFGTTFTQPIPDNLASDQYAVLCGDAPVSRNLATYAAAVQQERQAHPLTNGMLAEI